ncbi:MAG: Ig-like domain-containing protein [Flavobacteriaceae bacterium]|tara:strand:+ start:1187 stop:2854 length:1668 start_codon:yes stop_codon:yes gene_type:complete
MKFILKYCIYIFLFFSIINCAKKASPTGGPKDTIPPVLISASPKLNTTFFDKEEVKFIFNEYVTLNDIDKQLIISPPLKIGGYKLHPTMSASKKITLSIIDTLLENTTYTFNFGEGIKDYNEGNKMSFFSYTISTGAEIDSLNLKGTIKDAIEMKPDDFISLQLYPVDSSYNDSAIYKRKPFYVASTLDTTVFELKNLKEGKYELIALKDFSNNYFFDQNIDQIGFLNTPISLPLDSIIELKMFKEKALFSWANPFFINNHHIGHGYYGDYENQKFKLISNVPKTFEFLINKNRESDTLNYWFKGIETDSLKFEYPIKDSIKTELVNFKNPIKDSLIITQITIGAIDLTDIFKIKSNLPIVSSDSSLVKIRKKDSTLVPAKIKIDENYDRVEIDFKLIPNDMYDVELLPNALKDFWGNTHDTLYYRVSTKKVEDYGNIFIQLIYEDSSEFILELLKDNKVIKSYTKSVEDSNYSFKLLNPGKYFLRLIKDSNNNDKWDTGNYLKKIQPEEVIYYPFELELRANWDLNETFNTTQNYLDLLKNQTSSDTLKEIDGQ